jgi:hypothetical protein
MLFTPEFRLTLLAHLVKTVPDQKLGRTQLMKLLYFLQELKEIPLGYDFTLFTYGPFDSEVLSDLSTACGQEIVNEESVIYSQSYGYRIKPTSKADELSDQFCQEFPDLAGKVDEVVREFGACGAAELELRSTILFVDRECLGEGHMLQEDNIADRVRQIKPHFERGIIQSRVTEMRNRGHLHCIPS